MRPRDTSERKHCYPISSSVLPPTKAALLLDKLKLIYRKTSLHKNYDYCSQLKRRWQLRLESSKTQWAPTNCQTITIKPTANSIVSLNAQFHLIILAEIAHNASHYLFGGAKQPDRTRRTSTGILFLRVAKSIRGSFSPSSAAYFYAGGCLKAITTTTTNQLLERHSFIRDLSVVFNGEVAQCDKRARRRLALPLQVNAVGEKLVEQSNN